MKFLGKKMGKKWYLLVALFNAYVILDDWRFLLISEFKNQYLLFALCITNLVGISYIICNVFFMPRQAFNNLTGKNLKLGS
jgi:hypothetical protein